MKSGVICKPDILALTISVAVLQLVPTDADRTTGRERSKRRKGLACSQEGIRKFVGIAFGEGPSFPVPNNAMIKTLERSIEQSNNQTIEQSSVQSRKDRTERKERKMKGARIGKPLAINKEELD